MLCFVYDSESERGGPGMDAQGRLGQELLAHGEVVALPATRGAHLGEPPAGGAGNIERGGRGRAQNWLGGGPWGREDSGRIWIRRVFGETQYKVNAIGSARLKMGTN